MRDSSMLFEYSFSLNSSVKMMKVVRDIWRGSWSTLPPGAVLWYVFPSNLELAKSWGNPRGAGKAG